jgi:hypothetical protein
MNHWNGTTRAFGAGGKGCNEISPLFFCLSIPDMANFLIEISPDDKTQGLSTGS